MAKSTGPVVGLDIGSSFIKVVEVVSRGGRPEITAVGIMPTPADAVIQGLVIDPPALAVTVRHLLEVAGVKSRRAVSSMAGPSNVTVRIIEVPRMPDRELAETMRYEIDRFVPFAHGQQIEKAYQALPIPATTEGNMQVALAVAVQDVVTSHMQCLRAAGLEPIAIEVEPLAVARSLTGFADNGRPLQETIGIINMGSSNTELSIVTGGLLVFPRTISIGGDSFTKAIAENLGMRMDAAERLKRQYAKIDLEHISQSAGAVAPQSGGAADFGLADFGGDFGVPPSFEYNKQAGGAPAAPGLNPFMYGGAQPPSGETPAFAAAADDDEKGSAASVFDLEEEGDDLSSLFPGQQVKTNPPVSATTNPPGSAQASPPAPQPFSAPPAAAPPSAPGSSAPGSSAPAPISGFDLGEFGIGAPSTPPENQPPAFGQAGPAGETPSPMPGLGAAPEEHEPLIGAAPGTPPPAGGMDGGFDLSGFGIGPPTPAVGHVSDASAGPLDEEGQTARQVQEILLPVLGELVTELRRSLEYYRSHNPTLPISRILLAGGSSRLENLEKFLENELGIPVAIANPLAYASVNVPAAPPGWLQQISPVLTVAIGLGERDMLEVPRDYVPLTVRQAA